jgi:hypothetical protein
MRIVVIHLHRRILKNLSIHNLLIKIGIHKDMDLKMGDGSMRVVIMDRIMDDRRLMADRSEAKSMSSKNHDGQMGGVGLEYHTVSIRQDRDVRQIE